MPHFPRNFLLTTAATLTALCFSGGVRGATNDPAALKFFETRVRPLLADQCFKCHGEKKRKANLRLDNLHDILQGGDGGPSVVPGDAAGSLLMKAVLYE